MSSRKEIKICCARPPNTTCVFMRTFQYGTPNSWKRPFASLREGCVEKGYQGRVGWLRVLSAVNMKGF